MRRLSDRRVATMFALVALSGFCFALVWVRAWHTGSHGYGFLVWNLELAWIPFIVALVFYDSWRRGRSRWLLVVLGSLWLLFLPNAPYMVTDLVHLGRIPGAPLWYDGAMISAFAGTGLLLGLGSVFLVHSVALRTLGPRRGWAILLPVLALCSAGVVLGRFARLNSWDALRTLGPRLGWAMLLPVLALCSAGVVLGRFARLNSWDALVRPGRLGQFLVAHAADPLASRRELAATIGYAVFLVLAYVVLYAVSSLRPDPDHDRRR